MIVASACLTKLITISGSFLFLDGPSSYPTNRLAFGTGTFKNFCLQYKSFENTMGKGEIAHNEQFLLFPQFSLPFWRTFHHIHKI